MRRRLLQLATALSLILCLATIAVWVISLWKPIMVIDWPPDPHLSPEQRRADTNRVGKIRSKTDWVAGFRRGQMRIMRWDSGDRAAGGMPGSRWERGRWGFVYGGTSYSPVESYRWWQMPIWPLTLLFAVAPTIAARKIYLRRRAHARRQRNLCPTCGYDLRATPDRCPECGEDPNTPSSIARLSP